jgi:DNA-binding transcriptional LysR family regulator
MFRLLVVPGVTVDKWSRLWAQRQAAELRLVPAEAAEAAGLLLSEQADAGLVRLPVDQEALHAIALYTETTVAVVPRDHLIAAADEVTLADLAGEILVTPADDVLAWTDPPGAVLADRPATTAAAVELVAASVGVLVVPQSLARLYHRRDLTYRPVAGAPTSSVALAWPRDGHNDLVEEMIGIVRGRTPNSTRGRTDGAAVRMRPTPKRTKRRGG